MIYNDGFLEYLETNLGGPVKTNPKNVICNCPWCDIGVVTSKAHLWISKEAPMFHCFRGSCQQSGSVKKLLKKIEGHDRSSKVFVNAEKIQQLRKTKIVFTKNTFQPKKILIPELREDLFPLKALYLRQRLKFTNIPLTSIKGLVFDVKQLLEINNIALDEKIIRFADYIFTNFVGFISEHQSRLELRNINSNSEFRYYKIKLQESKFLDYYKLPGNKTRSNHVVLAEGIYDIFSEHIFDTLGLKKTSALYASGLSTSYAALIKSLVFHEHIYRPDVHILSDSNIKKDYYDKMLFFNKHVINSLHVYYNRSGKDFNDTPVDVGCMHIIN